MSLCDCKGLAPLAIVALLSCANEVTHVQNSERPALSLSIDEIRSVPELDVDLPPESRPWELNDSVLIVALEAVGGRAFVGLKGTNARKTAATLRTELVPFSPRPVARGTRAAISPTELADALEAVERYGARIMEYFDALGLVMVTIDPALGPELRADTHVDFLEPVDTSDKVVGVEAGMSSRNRLLSLAKARFTEVVPSNMDTVRAQLAWPYSTGYGGRLLIIDSGHERGHADLPLVPLANCLGLYNGCTASAPNHHGTLVSGVALPSQNGIGIVGVAPGMRGDDIFYWGACNGAGDCDGADIVAALNWSVSNLGPRGVINVSIAGTCSLPKALGVSAAYNAGHVLVAAVGNDGQDTEKCIAMYSEVIAVAGIKPDRTFAHPVPVPKCNPAFPGSNWGDHVDVVAPYWAQLTTFPPSSYIAQCGTSLASPTVAGIALLLRARYPTWANWQVRQRIIDTAQPLGPPGWDDHFGWGLVRAHLASAFDPPLLTPSVVSNKAKLTWQPIPFAVRYDIYFSVTPVSCPNWELLTSTTSTTFTAGSPAVSSYYGTAPPGQQSALNLYVVGIAADGTTTKSSSASFLTVISNPPC